MLQCAIGMFSLYSGAKAWTQLQFNMMAIHINRSVSLGPHYLEHIETFRYYLAAVIVSIKDTW